MPSPSAPGALAAQRRRRIHTLRTRIATIGVAAFLALWAGLFVQLATGHDPGLNDGSPSAVVQSADPAATDPSSDAWPDDGARTSTDGWPDDGAPTSTDGWPDDGAPTSTDGWPDDSAPTTDGGAVQDGAASAPSTPSAPSAPSGGAMTTRQS